MYGPPEFLYRPNSKTHPVAMPDPSRSETNCGLLGRYYRPHSKPHPAAIRSILQPYGDRRELEKTASFSLQTGLLLRERQEKEGDSFLSRADTFQVWCKQCKGLHKGNPPLPLSLRNQDASALDSAICLLLTIVSTMICLECNRNCAVWLSEVALESSMPFKKKLYRRTCTSSFSNVFRASIYFFFFQTWIYCSRTSLEIPLQMSLNTHNNILIFGDKQICAFFSVR